MFNLAKITKKFFEDEINDLYEVSLNDKNNDEKILKNLILITKYHNRIHLISYLYLKQLNQILLLIFIVASFVTGLMEIINYKINFSEDIYLVFGITDIFLSLIMVSYKNMKIPNTEQQHYQYHIQYKNLLNDINLNISIHNKPNFIYKNLDVYLIDITNKINKFNLTAPKIPDKILNKYNIKKLYTKKNSIRRNAIYDSKDIEDAIRIDDAISNDNISLDNIKRLSKNDIKNFKDFIDKIDNINVEKENKQKLSNFKINSQLNKN